jgi:hypothetical protein
MLTDEEKKKRRKEYSAKRRLDPLYREKANLWSQKWRERNPEREKELKRAYYLKHRDVLIAKNVQYSKTHHLEKTISRRNRFTLLRKQLLDKFKNRCAVCGIEDARVLQLDHVFGGGRNHLKESGGSRWVMYKSALADTLGKFQLLCANCNWIKRLENKEHKCRAIIQQSVPSQPDR